VGYFLALGGTMWLLAYGQRRYGWRRLAAWGLSSDVMILGVMGLAPVFVTVTAMGLGLYGKLPGTGRRRPDRAGFPVLPVDRKE